MQDTQTYIAQAMSNLTDNRYYQQTPTDLTNTHNKQVYTQLMHILQQSKITQKLFDYVYVPNPRTVCYYALPKMHKPERPPTGSPHS